MPFQSEAQRRYLWANEPDVAEEWAHEYPGQKNLPYHKGDKKPKEKKGSDMQAMIAQLGREATQLAYAEKLAHDTSCPVELIEHFAQTVGLPTTQFVKAAYANPNDYIRFLHVFTGREKLAMPGARQAGGLLSSLLGHMRTGASGVGKAWEGASGSVGDKAMGKAAPGIFETSQATNPIMQALQKNSPLGGSVAGRSATLGVGGGLGTLAGARMFGGGGDDPKPGAMGSAVADAAKAGPAALAAKSPLAAGIQAPGGKGSVLGGAGDKAQELAGAAGGMDPKTKLMMLLGGGAAVGGLGYMAAKRRKKKEAYASDQDLFKATMKAAALTKIASEYRRQAATTLCNFLDTVVRSVSLEKSASVRTVQREIAAGKPLSYAIKLAYPHLSGEQRGILASDMVNKAASWKKRANANCGPNMPVQHQQSWNGPANQAQQQMSKMARAPMPGQPGQPDPGMQAIGAAGGGALGGLGGAYFGSNAAGRMGGGGLGRSGTGRGGMLMKLLSTLGGGGLGAMLGHHFASPAQAAAKGSVPGQGISGVSKALGGQ